MPLPQSSIFWFFARVNYCYAKTLVPLIILTCNTFCRINIQPTINLIFPSHIGINTTSCFSHLFSFKGPLLTHSNFLLKAVEVIPYGSITRYFTSALLSHLDTSVCLRSLTANAPHYSWLINRAQMCQANNMLPLICRPPPGTRLYYTLVEELLHN